MPLTTRPYFGSGSTMVCPPTIAMPASRAAEAPPANTAGTVSGSRSRGKPAIARAHSGSPPMAYTSEIAFVAAMRPKSKGSSTRGVKKSTVCTRAMSPVMLTTAASSKPVVPASTRGSVTAGRPCSTSASSAAGSLHAQPPPAAMPVSRGPATVSVLRA